MDIYFIFVAVALIVSLDVAGLTISKALSLQANLFYRIGWAATNGFWHALLLAVYAFTIVSLINFVTFDFSIIVAIFVWIAGVLAMIPIPFLDIRIEIESVLEFVRTHIPVLLGLIALTIIWRTYDQKIISTPTAGDWRDLPPLARLVYDVFEIMIRFLPVPKRWTRRPERIAAILRWQAEAALVAVDMLALAVLMAKMNYISTTANKWTLIILVFFTVSGLAYLVSNWAIALLNKPEIVEKVNRKDVTISERHWWQIAFRLMEPWFIFYFALELIGLLLFGRQVHSVGYMFGASLLLFALMQKHGMKKIIFVSTMPFKESVDEAIYPIRPFFEIISDFGHLTKIVLLFLVSFMTVTILLAIIWKQFGRIVQTPELDAALTGLAGTVSLVALLLSWWLPKIFVYAGNVINWLIKHRKVFPFFIGALAVASIVPIYEQISESGGIVDFTSGREGICRLIDLGFKENHMHALQVSLLFVCLWVFSYYLYVSLDRMNKSDGENVADLTWTELVESTDGVPYNKIDVRELTQIFLLMFFAGCMAIMWLQQKIYTSIQPCFG